MGASKRVLKAMGMFGGVQAAGILCSVVRAKLIALWIGPMGVGLFAIFNTVLDMMSNATQLNMRQSAVRDISDASEARVPRVAAAVRWWARHLGYLGALLMLAVSPLLSWVSFGDVSKWWAFACLSVAMLALSLANGESTLLQGTGRLQSLAKSTTAGSIVGVACVAPLYYFLGIDSIIPAIIVSAIVAMIAVMVPKNVKSSAATKRENIAQGKSFIRLGAFLTVSALATTGASYLFLSYLNLTASTQEVGVYQAGYTLVVRYVGMVFTAIGVEYYPRLSRVVKRPRGASLTVSHEITVLMAVLSALIVVFIAVDQWMLQLLYSAEFMGALPMIETGILGAVFQGLSYCIAFVIVARGDGRTYVLTDVASAAIGLGLNIWMYSQWGLAGLGWSYALWYAIYAAMVWIVCHRKYALRLSRKAVLSAISATLLTLIAISLKYALTH